MPYCVCVGHDRGPLLDLVGGVVDLILVVDPKPLCYDSRLITAVEIAS